MPATFTSPQLFANNAVSLLASSITPTDTSLTVLAGHGALFPSPTGSQYFLITLEDESASVREIIKVTGRTGDTLTFSLSDRAQEGTTAQSWAASMSNDTLVDMRITAETLRRHNQGYTYPGFPAVTNFGQALDQLFGTPTGSGGSLYDQNFTLTDVPGSGIITLDDPYMPGTVRLYVGGLRQKLGTDFTETGAMELTLNFQLTNADLAEGQNIVIDFDPA